MLHVWVNVAEARGYVQGCLCWFDLTKMLFVWAWILNPQQPVQYCQVDGMAISRYY